MINIEKILSSIIGLNNTFIGECPLEIDDCQWIVKTPGNSSDHFNKDTYDSVSFKIYVRGQSNEESNMRMNDIYKKLKSYIGANYVIVVRYLPYYVGRDVKHRSIYILNIEIQLGGY